MKAFFSFLKSSFRIVTHGRPSYYVWMILLTLLVVQGLAAYADHAGISRVGRAGDDIMPCSLSVAGPLAWPHFPQLKLGLLQPRLCPY